MAAAEPLSASSPPAFTHRETLTILFGLAVGMFLAALDQTIVATALPRIGAELQGFEHLSWIASAYLLSSTATTPIYGKLSDLYGRKALLQTALVIFFLTSALCALATTLNQLILFRVLQGLGGGGLMAMAHATIADVISPRDRGKYQAYFASTFAAAAMMGPSLGGFFADYLSWRWVFWINLPLCIVAIVMSQMTLKRLKPKRVRHKIDYLGALLIVSAIWCTLMVTTMGGKELPWTSPKLLGLAAVAAVLFGAAIFQELRASEPILPPRLFVNDIYVTVTLMTMLIAVGMLGTVCFLPLYFQLVLGLDSTSSGLMLSMLPLSMIALAIFTGRKVAKTGRYKIFTMVGGGFGIAGMLVLGALPAVPWIGFVMLGLAFFGLGCGLINPITITVCQNAVEVRDLGTATASNSFFRSMGGSFGIALFGAVLIARLDALLEAIPGHEALGPEPGLTLLNATVTPGLIPDALRAPVIAALAQAFSDVFHVGTGAAVLLFIAALCLREAPLKTASGIAARAAQAD